MELLNEQEVVKKLSKDNLNMKQKLRVYIESKLTVDITNPLDSLVNLKFD
jgi:hypothetical protein